MRTLAGFLALAFGLTVSAAASAEIPATTGYSSVAGSSTIRAIEEEIQKQADLNDPMASGEEDMDHSPVARKWIGFAVGMFESNGSAYIASGMSSGGSKSEALNNAVKRCRQTTSPAGRVCSPINAFNTGCGYLSIGVLRGTSQRGRWAISQTAQGAYDRCEQGGFDCNQPIGTCL